MKWKIREVENGKPGVGPLIIVDENERLVAEMPWKGESDDLDLLRRSEDDAKLIVSTPILLSTLKKVFDCWQYGSTIQEESSVYEEAKRFM